MTSEPRYPLERAAEALSRRWAAVLCLWLIALFVLLYPSLDLKLFADDFHSWNTVSQFRHKPLLDLMLHTYNPEFYRPLEFGLIRLNIEWMGLNPMFYRAAVVLGHLLTCLAVLLFCIRLGFGRVAGTVSAIFFGIHQTNAMAVLSCDAASQVYTTLFGVLTLASLLPTEGLPQARHLVTASVFLALSLLWKDSGTGFFVAAIVLVIFEHGRDAGWRGVAKTLAPLVVVFALYMALRAGSGVAKPVFGYSSRYELWIGRNLLVNPLLMLLSMMTPVGSTIVLVRLHSAAFMTAALAATASVAVGLGVGLFYFHRRFPEHRRRLLLLGLLFAVLFYPDALMTHVSELYTYKPAAIFCLFLGVGVLDIQHWAIARRRSSLAILVVGLIAALFACNALSIKHKEWLMRKNGEVAEHILKKMRYQVPQIDEDTSVVLANVHRGPAPYYSIFYMEGVDVLGGPQVFELLYDVKPRGYRVTSPEGVEGACRTLRGHCLTVLYDAGSVEAAYRETP